MTDLTAFQLRFPPSVEYSHLRSRPVILPGNLPAARGCKAFSAEKSFRNRGGYEPITSPNLTRHETIRPA